MAEPLVSAEPSQPSDRRSTTRIAPFEVERVEEPDNGAFSDPEDGERPHRSSFTGSRRSLAAPSSSGPPLPSRAWSSTRRKTWHFVSHAPTASPAVKRGALAYRIATTLMLVLLFCIDGVTLNDNQEIIHKVLQFVATVIFAGEYLARLYTCTEEEPPDARARFCLRLRKRLIVAAGPLMILELLSIVSLVADLCGISAWRGIVSFRLFRLLTIIRVEKDCQIVGPILQIMWKKKHELYSTMGLAMFLLLISSWAMLNIEENDPDTKFTTMGMSMWWAATALTTVGYGDIVPNTFWGKILGSIVAFIGLGLFALPAGILAAGFQEDFEARYRDRKMAKLMRKMPQASTGLHPDLYQQAGVTPGGHPHQPGGPFRDHSHQIELDHHSDYHSHAEDHHDEGNLLRPLVCAISSLEETLSSRLERLEGRMEVLAGEQQRLRETLERHMAG